MEVEEEQPWETALDLDDTDITTTIPSLSSFSLLRPCSHKSPPPPPPPETTITASSSRRRIPGPASAVQSAMHRHDRPELDPSVSTQEFIRRVEQDSREEFSRNPWLFAIDSIRRDGAVEVTTPLSEIKKCDSVERIDMVVAMVKSCSPNGLGDMMLTLKDPSDTIGATVHRKVLSVGEFGKSIAVGSVLILQKVIAFSSSCASRYLNITRSNIVKVISVDSGVKTFPEATGHAAPGIPDRTRSLLSRRMEGVTEDVQLNSNLKGKAVIETLTGKENSTQATTLIGNKQIENAANTMSKNPIHIGLVDSSPKALGCLSNSRERDISARSTQPGLATADFTTRNREDLDNVEKQRKVRDCSTAPCITEKLDSRYAWRGNGAQMTGLPRGNKSTISMAEKLDFQVDGISGTSSSMVENLDDIVHCQVNDVQTQRQKRDFCSTPSIAVANLDRGNTNGSQKRQLTDTVTNVGINVEQDREVNKEANGMKKPKLGLISVTSVQEWTDEQLDILDMDDY